MLDIGSESEERIGRIRKREQLAKVDGVTLALLN